MRRAAWAFRVMGAILAVALLGLQSNGALATTGPSVVQSVPVPCNAATGRTPRGVVVDPAKGRVYVASKSGVVAVYDTTTLASVATIAVPDGAEYLAIDPARERLYISNFGASNSAGTVTVVDTGSDTVLSSVALNANPAGLAVEPSSGEVYVALNTFGSSASNLVRVYSSGIGSIVTSIQTANAPFDVAVDPTAHRAYVTNQGAGLVTVISTDTRSVVASVPVSAPNEVAVDSARSIAYVTTQAGELKVVDGVDSSVVGTIAVGAFPLGVAVNESSNRIYTANASASTLSIVDGGTQAEAAQLSVPAAPARVAVDPTTGEIYATSSDTCMLTKIRDPVAAGPTIESVVPVAGTVGRYDRFEASIDLSKTYANPFDPGQIAVDVTFTAPSGAQQTVPAFWYQDFTASGSSFESYTPVSQPGWRVRFAPSDTGTYQYDVHAVDVDGSAVPVHGSFAVTSSGQRGFVRRDQTDSRFLRYDDGEPYLPVGHDAAFEDGNPSFQGGTQYYAPLFHSFGTAGENWTRVWMTDFNRSAIEWSTSHWSGLYEGAGRYSLASAWRMDRILQLAEQNGIEVQLVLDNHSQFSTWVGTSWNESPYNSANGGPVPAADPRGFFTDQAAQALYKQRLRYLVARYGAYGSLLAWELLNEAQFTGTAAVNPQNDAGMRADVVAWHAEMAAYLHAIDPYHHLVTSSSSPSTLGDELNALPGIDVAQLHIYATPPALHAPIAALQAADHKPVIAAEFGLSGSPENGFDPTAFGGTQADREHLIEGTHVHNAVWESALSASGGATWWWGTYVDADSTQHREGPAFPLNEHIYPPLVAYLAGEDWAQAGLAPASITTSSGVSGVGLANATTARLWVHDALNEYGTGARPGDLASRTISGATVDLDGLIDGLYSVEVWDTYGGGHTALPAAVALGGTLTIDLPGFIRDVALKVTRLGPLPDVDGDGVADAIDTGNGTFSDGSTTGSIVDRAGLSVLVTDAAAPDGVRVIVAGAGSAQAVLDVCGGLSTLRLTTGRYLVTCGSVKVQVETGSAEIVLGGGQTLVSLAAGVTAKVTDTGGGTYKVENLGGGPITVTVGGSPTTVTAGGSTSAATWTFVGFDPPIVKPPALGSFGAGASVPLKWQLLRQDGSPVAGLKSVAGLSVTQIDCSTKAAIGSPIAVSPLPDLQDKTKGRYQLIWRTAKSYAKTCRALTLDVGQGIRWQALFRFS
jgi:YVTN family beta-propeller protein